MIYEKFNNNSDKSTSFYILTRSDLLLITTKILQLKYDCYTSDSMGEQERDQNINNCQKNYLIILIT